MRFLLDTNICIYILKKKPPKVLERLQAVSMFDVAVSAITVAELQYGVYKSQRQEQNQAALNQFLMTLEVIPFVEEATRTYGQLRAELERQGTVIGSMDMLIASQAISLELILVTNNMRELSRIPGLVLENWVD